MLPRLLRDFFLTVCACRVLRTYTASNACLFCECVSPVERRRTVECPCVASLSDVVFGARAVGFTSAHTLSRSAGVYDHDDLGHAHASSGFSSPRQKQ